MQNDPFWIVSYGLLCLEKLMIIIWYVDHEIVISAPDMCGSSCGKG
jgi:hypothetical protein